MTFHLLSLIIFIEKRRKSTAEVKHEQTVQVRMEQLKAHQAMDCRLF